MPAHSRDKQKAIASPHVDDTIEADNECFVTIESGYPDASASFEIYHCAECGYDFDSFEAYTDAHNGTSSSTCQGEKYYNSAEMDIIEVAPEEQCADTAAPDSVPSNDDNSMEEAVATEAPLWDIIDVDSNTRNFVEANLDDDDDSIANKFFCYDCHTIFEDRLTAEEHPCGHAEANDDTSKDPLTDHGAAATKRSKQAQRKEAKNASTTCEVCNTKFSSSKGLKFHMRIHDKRATKSIQQALPVGAHKQYNELDQFYCEICDKSFEQNLLTIHKQMHQNPFQITCGVCNRMFENSVNYEMHLKLHKKEPTEPAQEKTLRLASGKPGYACQYCDHVFSRPFEKVKHERVHTGEKPYKCEVCGKSFRVSYSLTLHLRTHTDIRPYVCTTCNKRFKSQQVYSHHLRIHSAERQYECDVCYKGFRTSVQLYAHKKTHTKPFTCAVCNRPFATLYAVKSHMLTHESQEKAAGLKGGNQPLKYRCSTCGAEYSRPFALRLHMKSVHGRNLSELDQLAELKGFTPATMYNGNLDEDDEAAPMVPDTETAVLIAAAEADAAYINAAVNHVDLVDVMPNYADTHLIDTSTEAFDVDNFHSEEIITDWLK